MCVCIYMCVYMYTYYVFIYKCMYMYMCVYILVIIIIIPSRHRPYQTWELKYSIFRIPGASSNPNIIIRLVPSSLLNFGSHSIQLSSRTILSLFRNRNNIYEYWYPHSYFSNPSYWIIVFGRITITVSPFIHQGSLDGTDPQVLEAGQADRVWRGTGDASVRELGHSQPQFSGPGVLTHYFKLFVEAFIFSTFSFFLYCLSPLSTVSY